MAEVASSAGNSASEWIDPLSTKTTERIDLNAVIGGLLRDLAFAQESNARMFGYKRAAAALFSLEQPFDALVQADGTTPKIPGLGPASLRVCFEVLRTGGSPTVERAVSGGVRRADIERRRGLRTNVLSRAEVVRVLADPGLPGPSLADYRGDPSCIPSGATEQRGDRRIQSPARIVVPTSQGHRSQHPGRRFA